MSGKEGELKSAETQAPLKLPPPVKPARGVRQTIEALDVIESRTPASGAKPAPAAADAPAISAQAKAAPGPGRFTPGGKAAPQSRAASPRWIKFAAAAVLALGAGWFASASLLQTTSVQIARQQPAQPSPVDELHAGLARLNDEAAALRERLAASEAAAQAAAGNAAKLTAQARELAALKTALASLSAALESERAAHARSLASLTSLGERMARLEKRSSDPAPVASTQSTAVPRTAGVANLPPPPPSGINARARIPAHGYVLREVYRGVALVEGRNGFIEVHPGDVLPGAGRVRSIERRGGKWIVVTANGVIDTAPY
ncbi:MAG: hypothetical protein FJX29_02530 [Alphaproteobacteria bacterium]|nr:hypothetical protein [Alphaproteobacteria bacterium]